MFGHFKQCKHIVPQCVPQGVEEDHTLHKECVGTKDVHKYCLKEGLYGVKPDRKLVNLDSKTARRLRKIKLKIGCSQAAELMANQMANRALRFISAKAMRIIARKRHSNVNKNTHNKAARQRQRSYIHAGAHIQVFFGRPRYVTTSKDYCSPQKKTGAS